MKKIISLVMMVSFLLSMFVVLTPKTSAASSPIENLIFQDNFENYPMGGPPGDGWQMVWNGAGNQYQVITDAYYHSPTRSLQLMGSYGWSVVVKRNFSSSSNKIGYEAYLMASPGGGGDVAFCNIPIDTWGRYYAMVGFGGDGYIWACEKNNEATHQLQPFSPYTWYKIRVLIDRNTRLYDVWINDVQKGHNIPIFYDPWEILSLQFQVGWVSIKNYFDDVKVFEALAPSSTSISCSPNYVLTGSSAVCKATVSGSNPTGTITWSTNSSTGSFTQTVCTLSSGRCSTTYTETNDVTVDKITATYSGDANNAQSTKSCLLGSVVNPTSNSKFPMAVTNGIAQPNLYCLDPNLHSTGTVQQCYDANGLSTWIQLPFIVREPTPNKILGPVGYSEIAYGNNLLDQSFGNSNAQMQFPKQLNTLGSLNLWGTATYSLGTPLPLNMPYNLFYDLWLEKNPLAGKWPQSGDLEVGISLAYAGGIGTNPYWPAGIPVGQLKDQIYVNGQEQSATWDIYYELAKGTDATFYDFSLVSPSPQSSTSISVNFLDFISSIPSLAFSPVSDWQSLSTYSLMGVELGTEYAWINPLDPPMLLATWSWEISSCYLTTNSNNLMTIVTSEKAASPSPIPTPTVSPTVTAYKGASAHVAVTSNGQSVAVDQTAITGVKAVIGGPSLKVGAGLTISSVDYGHDQLSGTSAVGVGTAAFFDVRVNADPGITLGSDLNALVYVTNPSFTTASIMSFWDGSDWVPLATHFIAQGTVWCTLPVADLTGTPIVVFVPNNGAITFDQLGVDTDFASNVVVIDSIPFSVSELPVSYYWQTGSEHTFSFQSPLVVSSGAKQYDWTSTTGLSTRQSDSITVTGGGSVTGDYIGLVHDVVVTDIVINCTWVYQGRKADVNVTVANNGDFSETVTITLYYNITEGRIIDIQNMSLPAYAIGTAAFVWDTTSIPYCHNYTLTVVASITADLNNADNILSKGNVKVRIMGDVNGDGTVDMKDTGIAAHAFGSDPTRSNWNPDSDVNGDGTVDLRDIGKIARNFGKTC